MNRKGFITILVLAGAVVIVALVALYLLEGDSSQAIGSSRPLSLGSPSDGNPSSSLTAPQLGRPIPDFTLSTLDGGSLTLSQLRGKTVLINFWASWCPPCRAEMPDLQKVYEEYRDKDFVIVAVNIQEDRDTAANFIKRMGLTFPVALDTTGQVTAGYRITYIPTTFFVDKEGIVRQVAVGQMNRASILAKLRATTGP
ncbi:MAG: TlpA family protein disulfide reductase [Chloroflexi bacterium]|nr:TlpA family protein disulfide reductase [Chloroflexota bacterium]